MKKLIYILVILVPMGLLAGDPIPGIDITVNQSPGGINKSSTTNSSGEATFSGLEDGDYTITLKNNGKEVVIGKHLNDKVTILKRSKGNVKPIRLELSRYQDGNDIVTRKKPGRGHDESSGLATGKRQHKRLNDSKDVDASTPGNRAQDYNAARSNKPTSSANLNTDDCDGVVEITPMNNGRLKVKITCGK